MPSTMRDAATLRAQKNRPAGPAMRFQRAGALAAGGLLQVEEGHDSHPRRQCRGANRGESPVATQPQGRQAYGAPQPSIAAARGAHHPDANPARSVPAMDAPHQGMVALGNERQRGGQRHTIELVHRGRLQFGDIREKHP